MKDYTSLPLTVGMLSGLMWLPCSGDSEQRTRPKRYRRGVIDPDLKRRKRRDGFDRVFGACAGLVLLMWLAYGWERSTGLTFATRGSSGTISTSDHLAKTKRRAIGITLLCLPPALVYLAFVRSRDK